MRRKKAVVTGGSHGIGRGIVYCLAEAGYDVVFSYNTDFDSAQHMLETLAGQYPDGIFDCYQAKLTEQGAAVSFFRQAVERLGGLDLMVNNAGVTKLESIFDLTEETMDYLVNLMLRTYVLMMREAATYMANQGTRGNIINISSTRGLSAHPGDAIYGGIKAALNRIVQSVALDVASYGIRANNIQALYAGGRSQNRPGPSGKGGLSVPAHSAGALWYTGGCGESGGIPGLGQGFLYHRPEHRH